MPDTIRRLHGRIDEQELSKLLIDHTDANTLAQLTHFGQLMVGEVQTRVTAIEAKAASIIGWTSASIAFLVATAEAREYTQPEIWTRVLGVIAAAVAILASANALSTKKWEWPSQTDWFNAPDIASKNSSRLQILHLLWLRKIHEDHWLRADEKIASINVAQVSLAAMAFFMFLAYLLAIA